MAHFIAFTTILRIELYIKWMVPRVGEPVLQDARPCKPLSIIICRLQEKGKITKALWKAYLSSADCTRNCINQADA